MLILIEKDPCTRIPKEVTPEEAASLAGQFTVLVVTDEGGSIAYADWLANQAPVEVIALSEDTTLVLEPVVEPVTEPVADPVIEDPVVEDSAAPSFGEEA